MAKNAKIYYTILQVLHFSLHVKFKKNPNDLKFELHVHLVVLHLLLIFLIKIPFVDIFGRGLLKQHESCFLAIRG
jgi:hypothetical protein